MSWKNIYKRIHEKAYNLSFSKELPSDWVERNIILPDGVSRYKGLFSYNISPYAKEIVNRLSSNDPSRCVAIMKCAQIGLTQGLIIPGMAYVISEDPAPMLFMAGDKELARTSIQERLDPILQSSGLMDLIRPSVIRAKNQRTGNTDSAKEYAGGRLTIEGTNNVDKMRQISVKIVFADDWEAAPRNNKDEGSIRKLIEGRQTSYGNVAKTFFVSTPTIKQTSNIEPVYELGDQRKWHWKCPHCGEWITPVWRIEVEKDLFAGIYFELDKEGKPVNESVCYVCQNCFGKIYESEKYDLNLGGKWIPTSKPKIENYYSYQLNALVIPPGFITWVDLVKEWCEACPVNAPINKAMLQTFLNIRMGETWEETGETPKVMDLMHNVRDYDIGIIPDKTCEEDGNGKIVLLTLACDLNGVMERHIEDVRLDWEILAHTSNGQCYSIDHGSIGTFKRARDIDPFERARDGDRIKYTYSLNQENSVWNEFEEIMKKDYYSEYGEVMNIGITVIDTGYFTNLARQFIAKFDDRLVIGIKGKVDGDYRKLAKDTPLIAPSREMKNLYLLEVNQLKDLLSENMKLRAGFDGTQPEGFMNYPSPSNGKYTYKSYFIHYEGEKRTELMKNDEVVGFSWVKKNSGSLNHFWDVRVYNLAAREIYLDMIKRSDSKLKNWTWVDLCNYLLS